MTKKKEKNRGEDKRFFRVYPKKDRVGWLINVAGVARFQPAREEDYILLPQDLLEKAGECRDIIIKLEEKQEDD